MISKEIIEAAKRVYFPGVLMSLGVELEVNGNRYQLIQHDSLKIFQKNEIWLYKWYSQGGEVGDSIQYLQRYHNINFSQAVNLLLNRSIQNQGHQEYFHKKRNKVDKNDCQRNKNWQTKNWQASSEQLVLYGKYNMSNSLGDKYIRYLKDIRGLTLTTIIKYNLGCLPAKKDMPSKLVIPCYSSKGKLIRVKFRMNGSYPEERKYRLLKGSNFDKPYPLGISPKKPVIIVESDLDGMLISQESGERIGVLCLGSTSVRLKPGIINYLNKRIPFVLISMDNDKSGRSKSVELKSHLENYLDWPVVEVFGNDPGEVWKKMSIKLWIESGIKKYETSNRVF
jgi:hypothetical protein